MNRELESTKALSTWETQHNTCGSSGDILNENIAPVASNLCNTDDACVNTPIQICIQQYHCRKG